MARLALLCTVALLAACDRHPNSGGAVDLENPLEIAARERGLVHNPSADPSGVLERRHDLGRDVMCIVPDGQDEWRFVLSASFGTELTCSASGGIGREGDSWRLAFSGHDGCELVVYEEGDELRLPGTFPEQCEKLCSDRVSLRGLRLPRASWSADDARRLQIPDNRGNMGTPCRD
ncbi:hypothetical protein K5P26_06245 [Sphingopyxis sp. XHP0097]|jgi:hypothetical protein|uniref:Lipoprotein n=1 Tax=Sphingopyxis jiangsuensis TaxID=2871171 RepID=A0ABS7MDI2_9SPHN|nr:hypothetical protein [Sphingopyxis jiangsuensis]MBY4636739.1 hypothetical protein [Sphingopyxis jiangsuensis]